MKYQFNTNDKYLINKLQNDPAVLFLGQSYLMMDNRKDFFLKAFTEKYQIESTLNSYDDIFKAKESNKDAIRSWSQKMFENISLPESIESISKYPWSHLYTSAIDNNLVRAFKNDLRSVQPIFNQSFKLVDPRSRNLLHETYLYGQIQFSDVEKAAPLSKLEFAKRSLTANLLLSRLAVDIITPKGTLIIDGWDPTYDWLSSSDFYSILSLLGPSQIHLFSANENIKNDEFVIDLVDKGKLILHDEKLSYFLDSAINQELLDISKIAFDESGHWTHFGSQRVKVPNGLRNSINRNAILLSKSTFESSRIPSESEFPSAFREFISYSTTVPKWEGYQHGFAFKRDFVIDILKIINVNNVPPFEVPFIVYGQASSGKTMGLGQIAYEMINNDDYKAAFLFIERSYRRIDENGINNIDDFCLWAEENGADRTVIFYDGMLNYESYYSLLSHLTSRGRKILLIGTSYIKNDFPPHKNFIHVPIEFTNLEKQRFETFIKRVVTDIPSLSTIINSRNNKNFLSMLYHYLPESKSNISDLIKREAKFYSEQAKNMPVKKQQNNLLLKDLLQDLGFKESTQENDFERDIMIGGENATLATQFINLVMVIGKHGLPIPFELLVRILGSHSLQAEFFNSIPNTDLIRWFEDHNGNIDVGPRTQLEAIIYSNSLGGISTEIDFIKKTLSEIRDSRHSTQEDKEVEFTTQLLQHLKQKGTQYRKYIFEYAGILTSLRQSKQAVHQRLMLQEASLLQESIKDTSNLPPNVIPLDILAQAEAVIREAISMDNSQRSPTYVYLKVELASILGSKAVESKSSPEISKMFYEEARQEILSFSFSSQNYHALDVLLWTIRDQAKITSDKVELAKLYVEAQHYLQFGSEEGIILAFQEDFNKRSYEIGQAFKDYSLSDDAFDKLHQSGSKAGYFLRAKEKLMGLDINKNEILNASELVNIENALSYLQSCFNEIRFDSQCLYLFLKLWWLSKTSHSIFYKERTVVNLKPRDWTHLLEITTLLLENSNAYITPTVKYLKAISQFQTDNFIGAFETFRELSSESDNSNVGSRRIKKYYLSSNPNGLARSYFGVLQSNLDSRNSSSMITVDGLVKNIKCFYSDFRRPLAKDEAVDFAIAFNFIGPVAVPLKNL